jgi:hypothetical protein
MAPSLITPSRIIAGDTAEWLIALTDYPAPAWTLKYVLVKDGKQIVITASQYGSTTTHHIDVSATTTDDWPEGEYSYRATVSDGIDRYSVESGTIEIVADFASATTGYDDRSFAKKALDAIEAVILGRASHAQLEYTIAGRQLKFIPPSELMDLRDRFRVEYRAEESAKQSTKTGKSRWGQVKVRFS